MRWIVLGLLGLSLTSCENTSDNAKSTTGPSIEVHCDAAIPQGTTAKIVCPGGAP